MQAVHLTTYGDPLNAFEPVDTPEPVAPGPGQVLIQVMYSPVNSSDMLVAKGVFPTRPTLPAVVGNEGSGVVIALGDGVSEVKLGDKVLIARMQPYAWAERVVALEDQVFVLPAGIDMQQASMITINSATASLLLREIVDLQPGSWVVQNAGNSGVGRSVIAIAKARGLKTISIVRRAELLDELKAAGGDVVLVSSETTVQQAKEATGGAAVALALDGVGGEGSILLGAILTENGVLVNYAAMSGQPISVNLPDLIFKKLQVRGFFQYHEEFAAGLELAKDVSERLILSGQLHVPVVAVYPLSRIREAVAHLLTGAKVLLDIGNGSK
ncbi:MAG: alcohol dehydrogenase [Pseudomonas sp.]|nr:alcohol dehydrogenase [Pseudomonas sp.]